MRRKSSLRPLWFADPGLKTEAEQGARISSGNYPPLGRSTPSAMPETSCRAFSRSNLRSFLASLRVALTARLLSFRSGVRFAIAKEYQHFRVPADFTRLARR
jgi:hypothetical protein